MSDLIDWWAPWSGRLLTLFVSLVGVAIILLGMRRKRTMEPKCVKCSYNLTGASRGSNCPECGHWTAPNRRYMRGGRRWSLIAIGVVVFFVMPVFVVQRRVRVFGWEYYTYVGPAYWLWPNETLQSENIGPYRVSVVIDRQPTAYQSKQAKIKRLFSLEHELENWELEIKKPVDLTGNGQTDIILSSFSGGAHCCFTEHIFLRGRDEQLLEMQPLETMDSYATWEDLDADGIAEGHVRDMSFAYWRTAFASSPAPSIVLRANPKTKGFDLAIDLMRAEPPSRQELQQLAAAITVKLEKTEVHDGERLLYEVSELWGVMLDLIYSGNATEADWFLRTAWPDRISGRAQFADDFYSTLMGNYYYESLRKLNQGKLPKYDESKAMPDEEDHGC